MIPFIIKATDEDRFRDLTKAERAILAKILALVTEETGVSVDSIDSRCRTARISHARFLAMALARAATKLSLNEIGRAFNRDHGTVIHAVQHVESRRANEAGFAELWELLLSQAKA